MVQEGRCVAFFFADYSFMVGIFHENVAKQCTAATGGEHQMLVCLRGFQLFHTVTISGKMDALDNSASTSRTVHVLGKKPALKQLINSLVSAEKRGQACMA